MTVLVRQNPLVSVVIPTHNRSELLLRAMMSVQCQTYGSIEVFVVGDYCEDNTETVVESFNDKRFEFIANTRTPGASGARNMGLLAARGEYIAFLDDDDEWLPTKLQIQVDCFEKLDKSVGLLYAWMDLYKNGMVVNTYAPIRKGNVFVDMLDGQVVGGCPTILIRRDIIKNIGLFDETLKRGNDGNYWRRISKEYLVDYVPVVLAKVHIDGVDRLSCDNVDNLKAATITLLQRLRRFEDSYVRYPYKKAAVCGQIAANEWMCGSYKNCLKFLIKGTVVRGSYILNAWIVLKKFVGQLKRIKRYM